MLNLTANAILSWVTTQRSQSLDGQHFHLQGLLDEKAQHGHETGLQDPRDQFGI
jgi:hypothetical protein